MSQTLFTIKEVSVRTGISTQLIRKWEERYGAVSPLRFPNGYRGYTKRDVEMLLRLKSKVGEGVPVGLAVVELKRLWEEVPPDTAIMHELAAHVAMPPETPPAFTMIREAGIYRDTLLDCFVRLDQVGALQRFDRLLAQQSPDFVLRHVLAPVLFELRERRIGGELPEHQEHFGVQFIRERLFGLKRLYAQAAHAPLVVTACAPGDPHESDVLLYGCLLLQEGLQHLYLGPAPSEKGLLACLRQVKPAALAFALSSAPVFEQAQPFYNELDRQIRHAGLRAKIFVSGPAVAEDRMLAGTRSVYLVSGDAKASIRKLKRLIG